MGVVLLALAGCGGGGGGIPAADLPLTFALVEESASSGVRTPRATVVNGESAWISLWAEHTAFMSPAPVRPPIDFAAQSVAAIFLGPSSICEWPQIASVVLTSSTQIRVFYRVAASPTVCAALLAHPAIMVRFANPAHLPVELVRE